MPTIKVSRGVQIRQYKTGQQSYEIQFTFQGKLCREIYKGLPVTLANHKLATQKKTNH